MDAVTLLRSSLRDAHALLEAIMQDVTPEAAHWMPPGRANPVGATYAHVIFFEDRTINGVLLKRRPLYETTWQGRTGISELMPEHTGEGDDYVPWTRRVHIDLPALRQYAQAVYDNTDQYIAGCTPEDLDKELDLSGVGGDRTTLGEALARRIVGHVDNIAGEISCLKGLQGLQGYPF
jgi:hypothetical protein